MLASIGLRTIRAAKSYRHNDGITYSPIITCVTDSEKTYSCEPRQPPVFGGHTHQAKEHRCLTLTHKIVAARERAIFQGSRQVLDFGFWDTGILLISCLGFARGNSSLV